MVTQLEITYSIVKEVVPQSDDTPNTIMKTLVIEVD